MEKASSSRRAYAWNHERHGRSKRIERKVAARRERAGMKRAWLRQLLARICRCAANFGDRWHGYADVQYPTHKKRRPRKPRPGALSVKETSSRLAVQKSCCTSVLLCQLARKITALRPICASTQGAGRNGARSGRGAGAPGAGECGSACGERAHAKCEPDRS